MKRVSGAGLALLLAAAGCEGRGVPDYTAVRFDSAGIEIVSSSEPATREWAFEVGEPSVDLTQPGGLQGAEFYRVADVVRVGDLLVVAEPNQVRGFSAAGEELWQFGREGNGPQEFRRIVDLESHGDSIVVFDSRRRRVSILDTDGGWVRGFQLGTEFPSSDLSLLGREGLVMRTSFPSVLVEETRLGLTRVPTAIVRMSWSGELEDTIGMSLGHESVRLQTEHGIVDQRPIFGHTSHVASVGDRVLIGDGTFMGFLELDSLGSLVRIVRGEFSLELTSDLLGSEWAIRESVLGPEATARLRESTPEPETRPAYSDLLVSPRGQVWLKEHRGEFTSFAGSGPQVWQVFGAGGEWLGAVQIPTSFRPAGIGASEVFGVFVDEFDVEHPQIRPISVAGSTAPGG